MGKQIKGDGMVMDGEQPEAAGEVELKGSSTKQEMKVKEVWTEMVTKNQTALLPFQVNLRIN